MHFIKFVFSNFFYNINSEASYIRRLGFSTGKMKYFIETFRALGVARGHSSYRLTKSVSFYSSVMKSSCQVH